MFDLVHKYKRVIQVFLFLIAITFATWGIESYTQFRGGRDTVATVNGLDITQREFAEELRRQQDQLRRMFGGAVDPAMLESSEMQRSVLESMIGQRLVASEAARAHMFLSREAVIEAITGAPEFQEDGKFSPAKYSAYLASQGVSDQGNVINLQTQIPLARMAGAIADTAIAPRTVVAKINALETQRREVSDARLEVKQYLPQVKIDEAQVKAHYEANQADFRTPERVRVEYVVLSAEALARQEPPAESELRAAYESRAGQFRVEEQRRASHILVKTKDEADKLMAELKKNPGRFADLAKKNSQDPGSAEKGGDLGWFGRGMMVKPFEDAAFKLGQNEMQVVESEFGFHVLRLTGIQAGKTRSYEEMQEGDRRRCRAPEGPAQVRRSRRDLQQHGLRAVRQPASRSAERFKLKIQTTGWIAKRRARSSARSTTRSCCRALFSSDALEEQAQHRRDRGRAEHAGGGARARAPAGGAAQARGSEGRDRRRCCAAARRPRSRSRKATAKLEQLRKGEDAGVKWGAPRTVSRRESQDLPPQTCCARCVGADTSKLPAYVGLPMRGRRLHPAARLEGDRRAGRRRPIRRGRRSAPPASHGNAQYEAYVASLRSRADVEIRPASLTEKK